MNNPEFKPTKDMIDAATAVFSAMAYVNTVRPVVRAYQQDILTDMGALEDAYWREDGQPVKRIREPDHSYLLSKESSKTYFARCDHEMVKAGFTNVPVGQCPLLIAENLLMQANTILIEVMEPITHISKDMLFQAPKALENYQKLIDLNLGLLAQYVDVVA